MSIPVISPIEITLGEAGVRRLPAPDYEIQPLPILTELSAQSPAPDPAMIALDEMQRAAQISEYHDFSWWDVRIRSVRARLDEIGGQ